VRQRLNTRLVSHQSSAGPIPGPSPDSDGWLPQCPAQSASRSRSSFVNTEGPASYGRNDEESSRLTAKAPTGKEMRMGMAARRPPARTPSSKSVASPQKPKAIKHLSRSLTPHLRAGAKRTIPSRRCARGSPRHWTRWVATRPSGRKWILGARLVSLARVPDFSTDPLLPPNAPYGPPSSLSFPFDESRINDSQCSFHS